MPGGRFGRMVMVTTITCIASPWATAQTADPLANILSSNSAHLISSAETWDASKVQEGAVSVGSVDGNGANWLVPYVQGNTATKISWGTGSVTAQFTICSITRWVATHNRILQCSRPSDSTFNWAHGQAHGNKAGVAYCNKHVGPSDYSISPPTNWLVACGRNITTADKDSTIMNGVVKSTAGGGDGDCELVINKDSGDWQLSKVYVWNSHLPDAVFADASASLNTYVASACDAGYSGPAGVTCTQCVAGKYKEAAGWAACTDCVAGKYSTAVGATPNDLSRFAKSTTFWAGVRTGGCTTLGVFLHPSRLVV
jgi:hypothetical protein